MTFIANPMYDAVFTFLMEDKKVAGILLSALLKKKIIDLEMHRHKHTSTKQNPISLFRIDFLAKVREKDGSEHLVLIHLQKTWLVTETLRSRQYLGAQHFDKENIIEEKNELGQNLPVVSIYFLGHPLGNLTEPVVYVCRRYLDNDGISLSFPEPFIEHLPHDSIIVQIPFLTGEPHNRLERLLSVFNQEHCKINKEHCLEFEDDNLDEEVECIVYRLLKAVVTPSVRRTMEMEDEYFSIIEDKDTTIMLKNKEIEQKKQMTEQEQI